MHKIFNFKNLYNAYINCRKNKRTTFYAAKFEINFESELLKLNRELQNRSYQPSRSTCFAITDPKLREVWAADFRDRVVHHLLIRHLEPIWEKMFIFHSFACRKIGGAHKAIYYLKKIITPDLFFLQTDIQSFFVSVKKPILFSIIKKHIKNPEILWLTEKIIFNDPTKKYISKGDAKLLQSVPGHKSLFNKNNCGMPIGNLTSQFFANVYLNELDQFIKHSLKCRHYFRYMDDIILLHSSKEQLFIWRNSIKTFLETTLELKLHPNKQIIQSATHGINFCGYIVKPDYTLIRRRTVKRLKNKLWQFNKKILEAIESKDLSLVYDIIFNNRFAISSDQKFFDDFRHILSSINSVYGFLKHANCYSLRKTLYKKHFGILKIYLRPANRNYDYFIWEDHLN